MNRVIVFGQNYHYHASSTGGSTAATSLSGVTRLNSDIRAVGTGTLRVISYDGTSPAFFYEWTDGTTSNTYSGTVSLPSYAWAPDVAILFDNTIDANKAVIVVIYEERNSIYNTLVDYVHYASWVYDKSNHTLSTFDSEIDISVSTPYSDFAAIDGDARGFCAMAWSSNGDLHTIAAFLGVHNSPSTLYVDYGLEKTLNLPTINGCNDIINPDVAIYANNSNSANSYIYYSYLRCGNANICEQTQHFDDIQIGSSVPSVFTSHYETVSGGNAAFTYPRIAANQYFAVGGGGNGALRNEFTVVAGLEDVIGGNDYSSIFAMTATNDGGSPNTYTYKLYNTTTNTYATGYTPVIYDFFATAGGIQYTTNENKLGVLINDYPVVAYDKNNDHVVIAWSMTYNEGTYPTYFPIGPFPAQVYANPDFDGNNDPSMQTPNAGNMCVYNGIDNGAANANSDNVYYMAVSSHNGNDLLYAWLNGSGTIYYKVVTSGYQPRLLNDVYNTNLVMAYPNPYQPNTGVMQLNINDKEDYTLSLYNMIGEAKLKLTGQKTELQNKLTAILNEDKAGLYVLSMENSAHKVKYEKISIIK